MVALFHVGQIPFAAGDVSGRLIFGMNDPFFWAAQIARILANGPGAVIFFFVLSGFVLTKVLDESREAAGVTTLRFLTGRIFRIYPGVLCALAIFVLVFVTLGRSIAHPSEYNPMSLLQNGLLRTSLDGVMWSMQLELAAAPLLLAVFYGWRRIGFAAIFWPYMIMLGLSFVGWWNQLIGPPGQFGQIYAFLAGMTVYLYGRKHVEALARPWVWAIAAGIGFLLTRHIVGWGSSFTYWFEAIFGSALVALLAFGVRAPKESWWFRALQFMGRISFSFYLLHPIVLAFAGDLSPFLGSAVAAGFHPLALAAALFVVSSAAIAPLAWLQFRLVEIPAIFAGKRLFAMEALQRHTQPSQSAAR
jgi:peptidoglycan/LPS O-acetylase OafA/YrhL